MIRIGQLEFKYPIICISIIDDNLIFTTKKIASRYVEKLSKTDSGTINTINFKLHNSSDNEYNNQSDVRLKTEIYSFEYISSSSFINVDEFFYLLGINSIEELFSDKILKKYKFTFITRNPIDKFLTGYFEKIDALLGNLENIEIENVEHLSDLLKIIFDIEDYEKLSILPQHKINTILNTFSKSFSYKIFNDVHLSFWNLFLIEFLEKVSIKNKVDVIDLNKFNLYGKLEEPSNKPWLNNWASSNSEFVNNMFFRFDEYFSLEKNAYNNLVYE